MPCVKLWAILKKKLNVIHVAGSKGKGSTCAMLAHVLKEASVRVGLYTSPHLNDFRERIRILDYNDKRCCEEDLFPDNISQDELIELIDLNKEKIESVRDQKDLGRITFYEVFTALAFVFFQEQECDWVILETGLGGRLDATNVCSALISVITPISLEHTHILGNTVEDIAKEKSGIIKGGEEVVIARQGFEATQVIQNRCFGLNIEPHLIEISEEEEQLAREIFRHKFSLPGAHQTNNVLTVLETIAVLDQIWGEVDEEHVIKGLQNVYWPIRFEKIYDDPIVILDGAHDVASMKALGQTLQEEYPDRKISFLMGMSKEKNREGMYECIYDFADVIVATRADHPRAHPFSSEEMAVAFADKAHFVMPDVQEALTFLFKNSTR